jgi:hypothetical protein
LDSAQALAIAATKSRAVNGFSDGPVSRSWVPFRMRIFVLISGDEIASPTPLSTREGMMEVKRLPIL